MSRPDRLLLSPDAPSLAGLFAQLRQCQGLISVDTATVHIAAGLHKPILGLYNPDIGGGNENFLEWHPNSPSATVLFSTNTREQDINSLDLAEFERTFRAWLLANQAALSAAQSPARA
nr:glycosyltransferase family 9 protein [Aeromonas hydrophila]